MFISSKYVGDRGKVYGLDMTDEMLDLANKNKEKMGVNNVEFIKEYIEIYTKEIMESIAKQKNLIDLYNDIDSELIDGKFPGAHVKAYK